MVKKKTSITIDPVLWQRVKKATASWAQGQGVPPEGMTSKWIARSLKAAADAELEEER